MPAALQIGKTDLELVFVLEAEIKHKSLSQETLVICHHPQSLETTVT